MTCFPKDFTEFQILPLNTGITMTIHIRRIDYDVQSGLVLQKILEVNSHSALWTITSPRNKDARQPWYKFYEQFTVTIYIEGERKHYRTSYLDDWNVVMNLYLRRSWTHSNVIIVRFTCFSQVAAFNTAQLPYRLFVHYTNCIYFRKYLPNKSKVFPNFQVVFGGQEVHYLAPTTSQYPLIENDKHFNKTSVYILSKTSRNKALQYPSCLYPTLHPSLLLPKLRCTFDEIMTHNVMHLHNITINGRKEVSYEYPTLHGHFYPDGQLPNITDVPDMSPSFFLTDTSTNKLVKCKSIGKFRWKLTVKTFGISGILLVVFCLIPNLRFAKPFDFLKKLLVPTATKSLNEWWNDKFIKMLMLVSVFTNALLIVKWYNLTLVKESFQQAAEYSNMLGLKIFFQSGFILETYYRFGAIIDFPAEAEMISRVLERKLKCPQGSLIRFIQPMSREIITDMSTAFGSSEETFLLYVSGKSHDISFKTALFNEKLQNHVCFSAINEIKTEMRYAVMANNLQNELQRTVLIFRESGLLYLWEKAGYSREDLNKLDQGRKKKFVTFPSKHENKFTKPIILIVVFSALFYSVALIVFCSDVW